MVKGCKGHQASIVQAEAWILSGSIAFQLACLYRSALLCQCFAATCVPAHRNVSTLAAHHSRVAQFPDKDSNLDLMIQSHPCCHCIIWECLPPAM